MIAALLLAQAVTWASGAVQNSASIDTGVFRYKESVTTKKQGDWHTQTAWAEYWITLSDINCIQVRRFAAGSILAIYGKQSDTVQKLVRRSDSEDGYREALGHMEIDVPPDAAQSAPAIVKLLTNAMPELAQTMNKGACAGV